MARLREFLLNEDRNYLGHRVSDVLTSMQDILEDLPNLGSRHLTQLAEEVVNQIRKIIHTHWTQQNLQYLKELQKVAVAIQRTIDERGDLKEILPVATKAMEELSGKLGVKVNNIKGPEADMGQPVNQGDFQLTGNGPAPKVPAGSPVPPGGPEQMGGPQQMGGAPGGVPPMA